MEVVSREFQVMDQTIILKLPKELKNTLYHKTKFFQKENFKEHLLIMTLTYQGEYKGNINISQRVNSRLEESLKVHPVIWQIMRIKEAVWKLKRFHYLKIKYYLKEDLRDKVYILQIMFRIVLRGNTQLSMKANSKLEENSKGQQAMGKIMSIKVLASEVKRFLFLRIMLCHREDSKEIQHITLIMLELEWRKILNINQLVSWKLVRENLRVFQVTQMIMKIKEECKDPNVQFNLIIKLFPKGDFKGIQLTLLIMFQTKSKEINLIVLLNKLTLVGNLKEIQHMSKLTLLLIKLKIIILKQADGNDCI